MKIVKMLFGSSLYGTNTPESDTDYKGIYLPQLSDCILGKVKPNLTTSTGKSLSKNNSTDIDEEIFSLQEFIKLALKGEMIALDMLHAPQNMILETSDIWKEIQSKRHLFYCKDMRAYLSYIKKQCSKYSCKGSRLADTTKLIKYFERFDPELKIKEIAENLPTGPHIKLTTIPEAKDQDTRAIEVCGRKMMYNSKVGYSLEFLHKFYDAYGARAKMAEKNEGLDFKAISHAFRAGLQLKEIYQTGDLVYPLKDAEFIRDVKMAKYHYKNDDIGQKLEDLIDEVLELSESSEYPDQPDHEYWENFILLAYHK